MQGEISWGHGLDDTGAEAHWSSGNLPPLQPHLLKHLKFLLLTPQVLDSIYEKIFLFTEVTFA